jgi:serine/threonine protein kinase
MEPRHDTTPELGELATRLQLALGELFRVERVLGTGGFAVVFRVRDLDLKRTLAVKVLNPDIITSPKVRERFEREAETIAHLSHPNIIPLHFVGRREELLYLAMPCVEGGTLADRMKSSGMLPAGETVRIVTEVASALEYAHSRGVVHRDVKPQNVLLDSDTGRCLVTDFGIARTEHATSLTSSGFIVGTPAYLSPEQLNGDHGDNRSDIYALGVMAYEMLTGRLPFEGPTPTAILMRRLEGPPTPVSSLRTDVPPSLDRVIAKCLELESADRLQSAAGILAMLDAGLQGGTEPMAPSGSSRARPRFSTQKLGWLGILLVAAAGGALVLSRQFRQVAATSSLHAVSDLVPIPAGEYLIGSDTGPANARPAHQVRLSAFAVGRHEVTVREYGEFVRATHEAPPWVGTPSDSSLPVTRVVWSATDKYCHWRDPDGGRLPTEEEWEAAARGVAGRATPWSEQRTGPRANLASAKLGAVAPPGSFPLGDSPEGVEDLLGNVWEWTSSAMTAYPGGAALPDSLRRYRVIRGGAFDTPDRVATTWFRGFNRPDAPAIELATTGFRCARSEQSPK